LSNNIILETESEQVKIQSYSVKYTREFEKKGLTWLSFFPNLEWLNEVENKLVDAKSSYTFTRGERGGKNALTYQQANNKIEEQYLAPLVKDLRSTKGLSSIPNKTAFCCSKSIKELEELGHNGALYWIKSFESQTNGTGKPLPQALAKPGMYWYEMRPKKEGDFVANVNYDRSLFISYIDGEMFIDQRMIVFTIKEKYKQENELLFLAIVN